MPVIFLNFGGLRLVKSIGIRAIDNNKEIKINKSISHEKLYRIDYKYDIFLVIKYNYKKTKKGLGSAIFLHLTKNYQPTAGCIALKKKDFLILLRLINTKTKIKIN